LRKITAVGENLKKMISQKIVPPEKIESELQKIWESLRKEDTNKANLFTLIVYSERNKRLNFVRDTIQNLIEKFPCRIIFITYEPNSKESYLKTAVSILSPPGEQKEVACDSIDIGVGKDDIEKVRYVVLPLLIPDLPVHLLWCEDPCKETKLLFNLKELSSKIIFDSETSSNIFAFSKFVLKNFTCKEDCLVDLNWLKTEDTRDILSSEFYESEKLRILKNATSITLDVNQKDNPLIKKFLIQAYYLIFWIASRLDWSYKEKKIEGTTHHILFNKPELTVEVAINIDEKKAFSAGDILKIQINAKDNDKITFKRSEKHPETLKVESSNPKQCYLPHNFKFEKFELGHFLANEMITQSISNHFIKTLLKLSDVNDN